MVYQVKICPIAVFDADGVLSPQIFAQSGRKKVRKRNRSELETKDYQLSQGVVWMVMTIAVLNQVRGHLVSSTRSPVNSYQVSGKGSQVLVCQLPGG
jgi:hypothetical protein